MKHSFFFFLFLSVILYAPCFATKHTSEDDRTTKISLVLEHSFDEGASFASRGTVQVQASLQQSFGSEKKEKLSLKGAKLLPASVSLSASDLRRLYRLAANDKRYYARIQQQIGSVPACDLLFSQLHDEITILIDPLTLEPVLLYLAVPSRSNCSQLEESRFDSLLGKESAIVGTVEVKSSSPGPRPLKVEAPAAEQATQQSFFSRYWLYIVIGLGVFLLCSVMAGLAGGDDK